MSDTPQSRWFFPTPSWLIAALLAVEGLLFLSDRFQWPTWHKGYAVLIAVASVGVVFLLMLLWLVVALVFRRRFQFSIQVATHLGRGRGSSLQLACGGDEGGEGAEGGSGGDREVGRGYR